MNSERIETVSDAFLHLSGEIFLVVVLGFHFVTSLLHNQ